MQITDLTAYVQTHGYRKATFSTDLTGCFMQIGIASPPQPIMPIYIEFSSANAAETEKTGKMPAFSVREYECSCICDSVALQPIRFPFEADMVNYILRNHLMFADIQYEKIFFLTDYAPAAGQGGIQLLCLLFYFLFVG